MRFTVIGHACLFIETAGATVLVDPWLSGSCYWRSWWHFPPIEVRPEYLEPDYVYLSHHHFDHFHFPSMRRLSRRAQVLIPHFGIDVMREEVRRLGFTRVDELPHGEVVSLPGGLRLASYQYAVDDSAIVVAADGVVLADLNDCKMKGAAIRPMLRAFGPPTFLFKSHSWAQAYPNCYTAADPSDLGLLRRDDYAATFIETVRETRPRYAVPFASMVAFLHPETQAQNIHAVTPPDVAAVFAAADVDGTELVVMAPGDRWDSSAGFTLREADPYAAREATLARLAEAVAPQIAATSAIEREQRLEFDAFRAYLTDFARALPLPVRLAFRRPIVFHVRSSPLPYWVVDLRHRRVTQVATLPSDWASLVEIPDALLADAIAKRILYFVHISLRIAVSLAPGGAGVDIPFWGLLSIWEVGYLPMRRALTPRALGVWWRRRIEIAQTLRSLLGARSLNQRVFGTLMSADRGEPLSSPRQSE